MRHTRLAEFCIAAALAVPCVAGADIFRYIDGEGVIHFTDTPSHSGYRVYLRDPLCDADLRLCKEEYPYRSLIVEACRTYSLQEPLLRAVMEVESDYNRYAVSVAGARGLMQLMPDTARNNGVKNPYDPRQNIMGGAKHLKEMLGIFGNNLHYALAAYNAGSTAVNRYGGIPPYPQTQRYVKDVLTRYSLYVQRNREASR